MALRSEVSADRWWPALAATIFAVAWLVAAWRPLFPQDWALENLLPLVVAWWLVRRHRRAPLSPFSYLLLLLFGIAHEIGSHYTYSQVPYREWLAPVLDLSSTGRNHYDRWVHFSFGLLCYRPLQEVLRAPAPGSGAVDRLFPLTVIATTSLLYELLEWLAAALFGGELGQAYLGTQGDEWDSHKDSALALLGGVLAMAIAWRFSGGRWPGRSRVRPDARCVSPPGSWRD